jgi:hypothetical protein
LRENTLACAIVRSDYFFSFPDTSAYLQEEYKSAGDDVFLCKLSMFISSMFLSKKFYINTDFWKFITRIKVQTIQMIEIMLRSELEDAYNQA